MKNLQDWAADCLAHNLLHSVCLTQLATYAFRGQVGATQKEIVSKCLRELKLYLSSLECADPCSSISNPASRLLKHRIASVAEYTSCQSHLNFLRASILKLLLFEEFVLSTGVEKEGGGGGAGEDVAWEDGGDGGSDFSYEYSSDLAYLSAFVRVLQTLGPFPVEKVIICFNFQDSDDMKSVLQALFTNCTKIKSIHLAGKSVNLVTLSKLKCFSKQLEELVLIDSFGSLTKDVFCVSLLGRPWIEYISSHDGRNSCLEPQFPALKHLWYQRQNSHQSWNDSFIKSAILTYYPNLKTLNWHVNDFNHNYALTKIPGLSGKQYNLENLLLTSVDLSYCNRSAATSRLICSVDVSYLSQLFPGLQDVSLIFRRNPDCQCSRSELRGPCETRATQIIETLTNVLSECKKVESLTVGGDILHLESILHPILTVYGDRLKSLGLRLLSMASNTQHLILSILSLCRNLENITITGNGLIEGHSPRTGTFGLCKWPKVKSLHFMLSVAHVENIELMQVFLSACCFVESLCISVYSIKNLCAVISEEKANYICVLILPVLDNVSDTDIDEQFCVILKHCPRLEFIYVPRKLKRWRYLQEKLWNRGITVKFTDLLVSGF
ncbi:hypothetical protein Pmani_012763 [Petrolisthes manimaculis]|uniref:Uncharacterized protein n=1 Tax=Petrolisthes manimaculis TaxID=1843537 RepID=A0AAE1PXB9_9EUCA|nr:hypothetical protein Pmani_012763 [Petrolisthes manimaculis]